MIYGVGLYDAATPTPNLWATALFVDSTGAAKSVNVAAVGNGVVCVMDFDVQSHFSEF